MQKKLHISWKCVLGWAKSEKERARKQKKMCTGEEKKRHTFSLNDNYQNVFKLEKGWIQWGNHHWWKFVSLQNDSSERFDISFGCLENEWKTCRMQVTLYRREFITMEWCVSNERPLKQTWMHCKHEALSLRCQYLTVQTVEMNEYVRLKWFRFNSMKPTSRLRSLYLCCTCSVQGNDSTEWWWFLFHWLFIWFTFPHSFSLRLLLLVSLILRWKGVQRWKELHT